MLLSIIIVNYNVKELLKDCLISVYEYSRDIDCEVFVVDNNSSDGSIEMLEYDFPNVRLIANTENVGFSTANNQAIQKAQGTYTLILNPDTLVYQDTFGNCIDFMQANADCGAIGVKMVNAEGKFLAESKRSFPNPMASLFKLIGLAQLFKKSDLFKSYYLDKLDKDEIHQVETLAGAFMWVRTSILQKVKGFDESFFMYGEDIDLSYRIEQSGYKNYYLGNTKILHYKGESTNKNDNDYVYRFYGAMKIFSKKHFPKTYPIYALGVNLLIAIQISKLSILRTFSKKS